MHWGCQSQDQLLFQITRLRQSEKPGTLETDTCQGNKPCQGTAEIPRTRQHSSVLLTRSALCVNHGQPGKFLIPQPGNLVSLFTLPGGSVVAGMDLIETLRKWQKLISDAINVLAKTLIK